MNLNFLHYYLPDPIILSWGQLTVRWYGLMIALAIVSCLAVAKHLAQKKQLVTNGDKIYDLALWLVLCGVIGARLYEVVFINWPYYQDNLWAIPQIWHGGLAIHGAVIAGLATLIVWCKINRTSFWQLVDVGAIVLPLGQAIGRWGNYFNQELFGGPTNLPWGILIAAKNRPVEFQNFSHFHPTFLYESLLNLGLFIILFAVYRYRQIRSGTMLGLYLIGYGLIRFSTEFIRIDPTPIYFGLRLPQVVSLGLIGAGFLLIWFRSQKSNIKN